MFKAAVFACLFLIAFIAAHAQQAIISGKLVDSTEKKKRKKMICL